MSAEQGLVTTRRKAPVTLQRNARTALCVHIQASGGLLHRQTSGWTRTLSGQYALLLTVCLCVAFCIVRSRYEPSKMSRCGLKGACPGSSIFVDEKSCPTVPADGDPNATDFNVSKIDWDLKTTVLSFGCFMYPAPNGVAETSARVRKPHLEKTCYAEAGSRCCPGYKGNKCAECCKQSDTNNKVPSCNGNQWHSIGSGEGQHCEQCPDGHLKWPLLVLMFALCIFLLPILVKASELMKHAGAATGPMLSVVNFVQSADLFQGLDLHWPKFFKVCGAKIHPSAELRCWPFEST